MIPATGPNVNVASSDGTSLKSKVKYGGKMVQET